MRRVLAVLKMRFSRHDARIVEYAIEDDRGIRIVGAAPTAEGLLTGLVRSLETDVSRTQRRARPA
jgi:KaiC/GvpD/RAD55 family RecA-like ATPase